MTSSHWACAAQNAKCYLYVMRHLTSFLLLASFGCLSLAQSDCPTPFYLPTLSGTSVTVCPGDSAVISVLPDEGEVFEGEVFYEWVGDWNGGATILAGQGTDEVAVTAGTFQLTVTDEGGCQGKRTFLVGTTSVSIPDFEVEPICDGSLEPVSYTHLTLPTTRLV